MGAQPGRPTVITQATVQKLEDAFKAGFSVSEACNVSGISRAAYYDHKANDVGFSDKMNRARAWVTLQAKHVVIKAITTNGDILSSKWWLERRAKVEFGTNAVDEDAEWEAQHTDSQADDTLRRILDMMSDTAEAAINEVATEARVADLPVLREATTANPALPAPTAYDMSHDVMADLLVDD